MESAVDFFRDSKLIKGYWSLPKSPSAVLKPFRVHGRLEYDKVN